MCPDLQENGECTKPDCQYAHDVDEIKETNFCYKTTPCKWYWKGQCRNGSECRFSHGEADRDSSLDTSLEVDRHVAVAALKANEIAAPAQIVEASESSAGKKNKKKQQQRKQEKRQDQDFVAKEISQPAFIQIDTLQCMVNCQEYWPQIPLHDPWMMHGMGYPFGGFAPGQVEAWKVNPFMTGVDNSELYNPAAIPANMVPEFVPELDTVKTLSEQVKLLSKKIRDLQEQVGEQLQEEATTGSSGLENGSSTNSSGSDTEQSGHGNDSISRRISGSASDNELDAQTPK
jgi:hypothetical protein